MTYELHLIIFFKNFEFLVFPHIRHSDKTSALKKKSASHLTSLPEFRSECLKFINSCGGENFYFPGANRIEASIEANK